MLGNFAFLIEREPEPSTVLDLHNLPTVLTVKEIARLARVSVKTVRRAIAEGYLKPILGTGTAYRIPRKQVLIWISGNSSGTVEEKL